jgi:acyl-CoA synthetase (AMP-forming)/AMP-acid ligase II/alkylation response protein AidB-like acyl-CoA dehydrogenase/acyl carrier protein
MDFEKGLIRTLQDRAAAEDRTAFSFLSSPSQPPEKLSYRGLDAAARALALGLQTEAEAMGVELRQAPVLIALPAGLAFLHSYFGCLYAGAIAVPIKYPQLNRPMDHTQNVAADCGARLVISTREMRARLCEALPDLRVLAIEDLPTTTSERPWLDPDLSGADIAHLQYTSGSTSAPKGVAISHDNIASNAADVCASFAIPDTSRLLCWLPHYHDLGLIFGCIVPVFSGSHSLLMPPTHFAQRPVRWLRAMQDHGVTHSAAPNFAFDACLALPRSATADLDLSAVVALLNGAEPVRAQTVRRFADRFAANGLGPDVQCPSYGMAENTLVISVNGPGNALTWERFDSDALQQRRLVPVADPQQRHRELVVCSGAPLGCELRIVNPDTRQACAIGDIGEIWVQGPSVAAGYWQRAALTQEKFHAHLAGESGAGEPGTGESGDWLRTGDLGGFCNQGLIVIGRLDDVMVLRGINYSPEDIELTVEACDPALEPGGAVVFSSEIPAEVTGGTGGNSGRVSGSAARLVVVHEVTRSALRTLRRGGAAAEDLQQHLVAIIRAQVAEQHDLDLGALVLLPPKGVPKTHTGKKKRHACRLGFAAGTFTGEARWISPRYAPATAAPPADKPAPQAGDAELAASGAEAEALTAKTADLISWLRDYGETRLNSRLMDERRTMPPYVVMDFANQGLLGMVAPKHYGGLGLRNTDIVDVVQQMAAIDTTLASFTVVNNALGLRPILRHGQPDLVDRLMPDLASGRRLASFAMTEAGAGSNIRNLSARGLPDGAGGWQLQGTKLWSGSAAWAGVINTFVRLEDPQGGGQAVSGFVLDAESAGLRQGPEALTLGLRAMVQNQVVLDGVQVTADQRLGEIGQGMVAATDAMEYGRFAIAVMSLGVVKRCLQLMLRHGSRREIATGALLDNPATSLRIAELASAASGIEAMVRRVAAQLDAGQSLPTELFCACKSLAPEYAWKAADGLIQQMAGRGYIETNIAPQILRDARVLRIFEGPTEPMNAHIGARLAQFPETLVNYVGGQLQQPELGTELALSAQQIWHHHQDHQAQWGGHAAAKAQAHLAIGEAASYGLMLACLRYQAQARGTAPDPAETRAQDWARRQFDLAWARALTVSPALAVRLERTEMDALRDSCAAAIGDVEQQMAGVETDLDGLIRRNTPQATPVPQAPALAAAPAATAPAAGEGAETRALSTWIKRWMASEFQIDAAEIDESARFSSFGMDSVAAMLLTGALEDWVDVDLPAALVWEHRSIVALATHVAGLPGVTIPDIDAPPADGSQAEVAPTDLMSLLAGADDLSEQELAELIARLDRTTPEVT